MGMQEPRTPDRVDLGPVHSGRGLLVGLAAIGGALALMLVAGGAGTELAGVAVLGLLFVAAVVIHPLLGIIALMGTMLLGLPGILAGQGRFTANNLLGVVLLMLVAMHLTHTRDLWFIRKPQVVLLAVISGLFLVSLVHSWFHYRPLVPLTKDFTENTLFLCFSRLAFLVMLTCFVRSRRHIWILLVALLGFTMVVLPSAFYNLVTWKGEVDVITGKAEEFRISSDLTSWGQNENRFAFMCNISILMFWLFAQTTKSRLLRLVSWPVVLALVMLVVATVSRSGAISLVIMVVFLLAQRGIPGSFRVGVVAMGVFALITVLTVVQPKSAERLLNFSLDQSEKAEGWRSTQSRLETNEHALEIFLRAPLLGIGPGNFRWLHRQLYPDTLAAGRPHHNSYLWAATEGGAPVLILYLALFAVIWRDLRVVQRYYTLAEPTWHLARFLKGYLLLFLFFSGFADIWLEPHIYFLAAFSMLLRRFAEAADRPARGLAAAPRARAVAPA
jgi:O-antigen ligase